MLRPPQRLQSLLWMRPRPEQREQRPGEKVRPSAESVSDGQCPPAAAPPAGGNTPPGGGEEGGCSASSSSLRATEGFAAASQRFEGTERVVLLRVLVLVLEPWKEENKVTWSRKASCLRNLTGEGTSALTVSDQRSNHNPTTTPPPFPPTPISDDD